MTAPDPQAVIADLMGEHRGRFDVLTYSYRCDCGEKWPALPSDHDREVALHEGHVAAVLAADPRIAIIAVPPMSEADVLMPRRLREELRYADLDAKVNRDTANRAEATVERVRKVFAGWENGDYGDDGYDMSGPSGGHVLDHHLRVALDPQEGQ